jgi:hypothetical protein
MRVIEEEMSLTMWGALLVAWGLGAMFTLALCRAAARADERADSLWHPADDPDRQEPPKLYDQEEEEDQ